MAARARKRERPQNPHLLDTYGAHRPPWNVAGVDCPVGQTGAMQDVTTATLPSCATYTSSDNTVYMTSAPCTLDHYDFALHDSTCLLIDSSSYLTVATNTASFSGYCQNETYIGRRSGYTVGGIPIRMNPGAAGEGPFLIENNYIDPTNFASPTLIILSDNSSGSSSTVTCTGNKNLNDGSIIPATVYPGTTQFFTCN